MTRGGLRVAVVPIATNKWVQQFVQEKTVAVQVDVGKLDIISDGLIYYQMMRFCQNTRLAFLGRNTPLYPTSLHKSMARFWRRFAEKVQLHPPSPSKFTPFCFGGFSSYDDILYFTTRRGLFHEQIRVIMELRNSQLRPSQMFKFKFKFKFKLFTLTTQTATKLNNSQEAILLCVFVYRHCQYSVKSNFFRICSSPGLRRHGTWLNNRGLIDPHARQRAATATLHHSISRRPPPPLPHRQHHRRSTLCPTTIALSGGNPRHRRGEPEFGLQLAVNLSSKKMQLTPQDSGLRWACGTCPFNRLPTLVRMVESYDLAQYAK